MIVGCELRLSPAFSSITSLSTILTRYILHLIISILKDIEDDGNIVHHSPIPASFLLDNVVTISPTLHYLLDTIIHYILEKVFTSLLHVL